ncbi:ABC transporter ATP-binding protein [Brachybacterium hainanense]|uniref:ABC transporter ATP-binding protein n=1 Tax=Brachybacterium hainanense TaxID=1541174 RepID=A0ABV6RD55_9MICO
MLDLAAVVLILPIMQLVANTPIEESQMLSILSRLLGLDQVPALLIAVLVVVVVLMVLKNAFTLIFRRWSLSVMARAQSDALQVVMGRYMNESYLTFRRRKAEDIMQVLNVYLNSSFAGVLSNLVTLSTDLISAGILLAGLLVLSPLATVTAIVFFGVSSVLMQSLLRSRQHRVGEAMRESNLEGWRYLSPALDGFKELKIAGASDRYADEFSRARRELAMFTRTASLLSELPRYLLEVIMIVGILLVTLVLFAAVGPVNAFAFLGVFAVAAVRLLPTLNRIMGCLSVVTTNLPNVSALVEQLETLPEATESGVDTVRTYPRGDISFQGLTFRYPDSDDLVLDGVSGVIPAGKTVALVGGSGAGKTTFVELLLGLFDPVAGSITVDGHSIHDGKIAWRRQLGMVAQNVYLQDATIRENIAFGVPVSEIDEDRVLRAVTMAELGDFIDGSSAGLDTVVGYGGARVSGGQKQRIGIARALYREPQLLVLDEATSALDNETESRITRTIEDLHGTMTIVVVAHRLSTVRNADLILFFSGGKIAARGTMADLSATNEEFAELVRLGRLN